jgi:hypothetical protein
MLESQAQENHFQEAKDHSFEEDPSFFKGMGQSFKNIFKELF